METWLLLIVMSLAVYRGTRLVVADTFPPVLWLRDRIAGGWRDLTAEEQHLLFGGALPGDKVVELRKAWSVNPEGEQRYLYRWKRSPFWLAELLSCPWCASGWVALVVTAGVWAAAGLVMPVLVWLAVWAVGALLAAQEWA
jgi:hypothetical protein